MIVVPIAMATVIKVEGRRVHHEVTIVGNIFIRVEGRRESTLKVEADKQFWVPWIYNCHQASRYTLNIQMSKGKHTNQN